MVKEMACLRAESSAKALQSEAEASTSVLETPTAPAADEIEAETEEGELVAAVDEDEEMLDARWSNKDDEDRPVVGP
jgi:hypothetical protein